MAGAGINRWDSSILDQLGTVSVLRGVDGTGVYSANTNRINKTQRLVKLAEDYTYWKYWNEHKVPIKDRVDFDNLQNNLFIGHTRAATLGGISHENSHPFDFSNIVGAHNGTLTLPKYIEKDQVDSYLMFKDISQRGLKPVLAELSDKCAYAISMLDKVTGKLWFALNGKRSLSFAVNKKRSVLYWASEKGALDYIIRVRHQEDVHFFTLAPGMWGCDIKDIRPDNHSIFLGYSLDQIVPPKPVTESKDVPWDVKVEVKKEDNKVHTLSDYRHIPAHKPVVHTKEDGKFTSFASTMKCCGEHVPLIEQWRMRQDKSDIGYFDNADESFNHFYCSNPKKDN